MSEARQPVTFYAVIAAGPDSLGRHQFTLCWRDWRGFRGQCFHAKLARHREMAAYRGDRLVEVASVGEASAFASQGSVAEEEQ